MSLLLNIRDRTSFRKHWRSDKSCLMAGSEEGKGGNGREGRRWGREGGKDQEDKIR